MSVNLDHNTPRPDGFYDELIRAHEDLSDDQSNALNARLSLILCDHIGDRDTLRATLEAAK